MAATLAYTLKLGAGGFIQPMRLAQGALRGLLSTGSQIGNIATGLSSVQGLLAGALNALRQPITLAADMESLNAEFEVMLGNAKAAKTLLGDIQKFANVTPFETEGLARNAKTLLVFGTTADKILPRLKQLGDIAGSDQGRFDSLTLAFAQMSSAGRLMGQDLLQMINAGFNPLQEIARKTGKSMAELKEDMEKGSISADMVADAFQSATEKGGRFFGNMVKQSGTFKGLVSTLRDTWANVMRTFGAPIANALKPAVGEVTKLFEGLVPWAKQVGTQLANAFTTFRAVVKSGDLWTVVSQGLTIAFKEAVNFFVAAFHGGVAAIGPALMKGFEIAVQFLRTSIPAIAVAIFAGIKNAFTAIAEVGKLLWEAFNDPNLLTALSLTLSSILTELKAGVQDIFADVLSQVPGKGLASEEWRKTAESTRGLAEAQRTSAGVFLGESQSTIGKAFAGLGDLDFGKVFNLQDALAAAGEAAKKAQTDFAAAYSQAPKVFDTTQDRANLNNTIANDLRKLTAKPIPVSIVNTRGIEIGTYQPQGAVF